MTIDYEAEYNNRARVPEHPGLISGWARDAAACRETAPHVAGVAYGPSPRQAYDYFPALEERLAPVGLFIHGGYWQALDRSFFSHMAAGPNERGLSVAVMGYDLCPEVTMAAIVDQTRQAALTLWRNTGRKVLAYGHSAGGHLTAILLATDWKALDPKAPADLVPAGLAISGLFELEPLVSTSVNAKLGLDIAEARRLSPALMPPNPGTRMAAFVGGDESAEYLRQSREIAANWTPKGCETRFEVVPGANHFTVIAGLASAQAPLTDALIALAG